MICDAATQCFVCDNNITHSDSLILHEINEITEIKQTVGPKSASAYILKVERLRGRPTYLKLRVPKTFASRRG